jgi:hypothetical protein
VLAAGLLTAFAVFVFGTIEPLVHTLAVLAWSAVLVPFALKARDQKHGATLGYTILITATIISPLGLTAFYAGLIYSALGLAVSGYDRVREKSLGQAGPTLSACFVALTIGAYTLAMGQEAVDKTEELILLGAMTLGIANVAYVAGKLESKMSIAMSIGAAIFYPILGRAIYLTVGVQDEMNVLLGLSIYTVLLSIVAARAKWPIMGSLVMALSVLQMFFFASLEESMSNESPWMPIIYLSVVSLGIFVAGFATSKKQEIHRTWSVISLVLGAFVVVPLIMEVLTLSSLGVGQVSAFVAAMAVYAVVAGSLSLGSKWEGYALIGMTISAVGIMAFLWSPEYGDTVFSLGEHFAHTILLSAALIVTSRGVASNSSYDQFAWAGTSLLGWMVLPRLLQQLLTLPEVGMESMPAVTTSWTIYGALIMAAGFRFNFKTLRVLSLVIFGVSIVKAFLYDMAEMDDLVKVIVFLLLGIFIITGGYLYNRARAARQKES